MTGDDRAWLRQLFVDRLLPVLIPIAIDPAHPCVAVDNAVSIIVLDPRCRFAAYPISSPNSVRSGEIWVAFSATEMAARVDALAAEIARRIPAESVTVGLLKGAAVFVADLVRALDGAGARRRIEFMRLSSYGHAKASTVWCSCSAISRPVLQGDRYSRRRHRGYRG